jgi:DNA-directed RNA polymerase specialized sigma24 family protein
MAVTMLHLVDDEGHLVDADIRVAVETAYRRIVQRYPRLDEAILAGMAESIAASMSRRRASILSPRQYAEVALRGKAQEWFRTHPGLEIPVAEMAEWERLASTETKLAFTDTESDILFDQMKKHLTERDRHILVLLEQDLTKPGEIAAALDISYNAAAKALQRVKDRMAALLEGTRKDTGNRTSTHSRFRMNLK